MRDIPWPFRFSSELPMRLPEPIEKPGFFWPPGQEDEQVPGVLHVSRSGAATLKVTVLYQPGRRPQSSNLLWQPSTGPPTTRRIVGIVGGNYVTLDDCFHVAQRLHFGGVSESTLAVGHVFLGAQYDDEEDPITFSTVLFSLDGLSEWPTGPGIRTEPVSDDGAFIAHIGPSESVLLRLPCGAELQLVTYNDSVHQFHPEELRVMQRTHIQLRTPTPRPVRDLKTLVARTQRFFSFVLDRTLPLESIKGSRLFRVSCGM